MEIKLVDEETFSSALAVYVTSWRESHRDVCSPEFLENRDHSGYLRTKLGKLWMIWDGTVVGVFSLDGESFGDLYIHHPIKAGDTEKPRSILQSSAQRYCG